MLICLRELVRAAFSSSGSFLFCRRSAVLSIRRSRALWTGALPAPRAHKLLLYAALHDFRQLPLLLKDETMPVSRLPWNEKTENFVILEAIAFL